MPSIRPRLRVSFVGLAVVALSLAQSASDVVTPEIRRVGDKLACLCGSCKNTVASCPMLGCHYAYPSRQTIAKRQAEGAADGQIISEFIAKEGKRALAVPPTEGIYWSAWIMPFVMIGVGLLAIFWFIKRYFRPATAGAPIVDAGDLDRYQEQIDKDLAKLD